MADFASPVAPAPSPITGQRDLEVPEVPGDDLSSGDDCRPWSLSDRRLPIPMAQRDSSLAEAPGATSAALASLLAEEQSSLKDESCGDSGSVLSLSGVQVSIAEDRNESTVAEATDVVSAEHATLLVEDQSHLEDKSSGDRGGIFSVSDVLLAAIEDLTFCRTASALNAASERIMTLLDEHQSHLEDKVPEIVAGIGAQIDSIPEGLARKVALRVVASLAEDHAGGVVSGLLKNSLPCDSSISEVWRSLCGTLRTSTKVIWNVLQKVQQRPRFQESQEGCSGDQAGLAPLAALRALREMLKTVTCTMAMQGFYPQVCLAVLTHLHFLVRLSEDAQDSGKEIAEHVRFAVETLRALLIRDGCDAAVLWMDKQGCWDLLSSAGRHLEGVLLLARALVTHGTQHLAGLFAEAIPKLGAEDEEKSLTARALFAGFLYSESVTKLMPRKKILAKLQDWQADPRPTVRWLSVHGLGNLAVQQQKDKQLKANVSSVLLSLTETDERAVREAIKALGNVISCHQKKIYLGSICVSIAEHLGPLLDDGRDRVRTAATVLFGKLLLRLRHRHRIPMKELVLARVVPFILHLQGSCSDTVECCEWTLARCSNFLGWKCLEDITVLAHYDSQEALSKICKYLVQRYPDRVSAFLTQTLDYMKSPAAPLRRAAAVLTGFLAFHMDAKVLGQDLQASLLSGLADLDQDPGLSVSSAASVSLLQVKQACRQTAPRSFMRTLRGFVSGSEKEKPVFENSPYKRKRCPEVCDELNG